MKKSIVCFLFLSLVFFSNSFAQTDFGVKIGSSFSRIVGEDAVMQMGYNEAGQFSDFATPGLNVGLYFSFPSKLVGDALAWKNEFLYSQRGGVWSDKDEDSYFKLQFDYIEVVSGPSFLIKEVFGVSFGLYAGYLLGAKQIFYDDGDKMIDSADADDLDDLKSRINYGVSAGVSYVVKKDFLFSFDYDIGLVNFLTEEDDEDFNAKHSGFRLGVTYLLKN